MLVVFGALGGMLLQQANPEHHLPVSLLSGQESVSPFEAAPLSGADDSFFFSKIALARRQTTLADQTLAVALSFKGVPYAHGTLDLPHQTEHLVVNMRELDCWTFVENSLAMALTARSQQPDFENFESFVQQLRYWGGHIDGYGSRVHYFSGWLLQAEKLGYLHDITDELGGIPYRKKIGYMTARPGKYPALHNHKAFCDLQAVEGRLNNHAWFFIPKANVAKMEHLIQEGDIIALTSWKSDLDIAHQGFAVKKNGRIYLLHASSLNGRVILSGLPLPQYMATQKGQTGIMVARLLN